MTQRADAALPARTACPWCHHRRFQVYEDGLCGGAWFACPDCGCCGDLIELAAAVWGMGLPATLTQLARMGRRCRPRRSTPSALPTTCENRRWFRRHRPAGDAPGSVHTPSNNKTALQKHRFDRVVEAIHAKGIGLDAIIHAGASDALRFGVTPVYYNMLRIGTMLFENPSPEHRNYTWKTKILQVKTLPKGWCIGYGCKVRVAVDTRVGLVAHVPNNEVTYLVRGQRVNKLLDDEDVITLDISHLPDVREGEEVTIILPEPNSPLDSTHSTPVTLRDGAGPGKGK